MKITLEQAKQIGAAWWREAATVALSAWGVFEVAAAVERRSVYRFEMPEVIWEWNPAGLALGVGLIVAAAMVRPSRCNGNCRTFRGKL